MFIGWTVHSDRFYYQCGLCHLDWLSDLVNALRNDIPKLNKGITMTRFLYSQIFYNDDSDNELTSFAPMSKSAARLTLALLSSDIVLVTESGAAVTLSNEENSLLEQARLALSEWT